MSRFVDPGVSPLSPLPLAAGVALPLLSALGYSPGRSGADGLAAQEVIEAAIRSHQSGAVIDVSTG